MEKCNKCEVSYPDDYLSPIITSQGSVGQVCGICALEISNEALGIKRNKFNGEMAEEARQDAIAWRQKKGIS